MNMQIGPTLHEVESDDIRALGFELNFNKLADIARGIMRDIVDCRTSQSIIYEQLKKGLTGTLTVHFRRNNRIAAYYDVPEDVYKALQSAKSIGEYFHANIRNNSRYQWRYIDHE